MSSKEPLADENEKSKDAENIKSVLALIKSSPDVTEKQISENLRINSELLKKYLEYLEKRGWITVKKSMIGQSKFILLKKKTAERGEKILPEDEESFYEVCESLTKDFVGVMKLWNDTEKETYSVGLMVRNGDVLAVTFEQLDTALVNYGETALKTMEDKFVGTKGNLEIYELAEGDFSKVIEENKEALLENSLRLTSLKIKIKKRFAKAAPEKKSFIGGVCSIFAGSKKREMPPERRKIEKIGIKEGFSLTNFARNLPTLDPLKAKRFEELRRSMMQAGGAENVPETKEDKEKKARLAQLREEQEKAMVKLEDVFGAIPKKQLDKKDIRIDEIRKAMQEKTEKIIVTTPEEELRKTVAEGVKIETSIDKLYQLVEKYGRLKINDALAHSLKVSKLQIEEWAMILEEHGLMELRYPTIGEPEIISKKTHKK